MLFPRCFQKQVIQTHPQLPDPVTSGKEGVTLTSTQDFRVLLRCPMCFFPPHVASGFLELRWMCPHTACCNPKPEPLRPGTPQTASGSSFQPLLCLHSKKLHLDRNQFLLQKMVLCGKHHLAVSDRVASKV